MPSLFELIDFKDPYVWAYHVLGLFLLPALAGVLFGKPKDGNEAKKWAYRGAGFEVAFVLLPFFIHFLINLFTGRLKSLLVSPELPMASLVLCSLTLLWIMKGARATKDLFPIEGLQIMQLIATSFFVANAIIIFHLTTADFVPSWFSIVNASLIAASFWGSYSVIAMMNYSSQNVEKLRQANK